MQTNNKKFGFRTIIRGFLDAFNIEKGIVPTLIDLFISKMVDLNWAESHLVYDMMSFYHHISYIKH